MVPKRYPRQGDEGGSEIPNKRRHFTSNLLRGFNYGRTIQESMSSLEPIIRKMVKETVDQTFDRVLRPPYNQVEFPVSRSLQLQFRSNLPETLFTGNTLLSKDKSRLEVVLYNSVSKQIVTCSPLSSLKLKIVVLDGDFGPDDREDWKAQEFDSRLVKNREGKRPLVTGETTVTLKDGVGYLGDLSFTDNSKWSRSGKFRLGAKAQPGSDEITIREAVSNAFRVKDHRGEAYQKHYPPALDDEVWRLKKIGKDGMPRKKLDDAGILTVRDFLRLSARDQSSLRAILEVSKKTWDIILGHATTCDLGEEHYMYRTTRGMLFFNSIHKVVGVSFDGVNYHPANTLKSFEMKRLVEELKQHAYNNLAEWIPVPNPSVAGFPMLLGNASAESFMNPNLGVLGPNFQEQDPHGNDMNVVGSTIPPPYHNVVGQENCSYHLGEGSNASPQVGFIPTFRNSFAISDPLTGFCIGAHHGWVPEVNYEGSQLSTDDLPMDDTLAWQGNSGLFLDPGNYGVNIASSDPGLLIPRICSPRTKWCKILAVVKWRILARNVAAKKCKSFCSYM